MKLFSLEKKLNFSYLIPTFALVEEHSTFSYDSCYFRICPKALASVEMMPEIDDCCGGIA